MTIQPMMQIFIFFSQIIFTLRHQQLQNKNPWKCKIEGQGAVDSVVGEERENENKQNLYFHPIIFIIKIKKGMLKQNPRKKTIMHPPQSKTSTNSQNTSFNTKGYFSSQQPYAEDLIKLRQDVFNKYRNKDNELVFINTLAKPSPLIQRGMLKPMNNLNNEVPHGEKVLNNFLKNYISRKEKKEQKDDEKYFGKRRESIGCSNIEMNPSISTVKGSRPTTKSVFSRVSTTRSMCSNKEN